MSAQKRHRYFVHKNIQRALVLRMMWHILAFAAASFTVTVFLEIVRDPFRNPEDWRQMITTSVIAFSATTVCLLPILAWDSIKFSHRFVGPILRLQSELAKVGRGVVPTVRLRSSDYWHELADEFNLMIDRLPPVEEVAASTEATEESRDTGAVATIVPASDALEAIPPVTAV
jgi:nitrogen fixation/metabolism regulation signal transduction histidine kinase